TLLPYNVHYDGVTSELDATGLHWQWNSVADPLDSRSIVRIGSVQEFIVQPVPFPSTSEQERRNLLRSLDEETRLSWSLRKKRARLAM
ncbi:hypothetical protein PMAYCL1PPCAC_26425, partial [Pristionchus mayeri]